MTTPKSSYTDLLGLTSKQQTQSGRPPTSRPGGNVATATEPTNTSSAYPGGYKSSTKSTVGQNYAHVVDGFARKIHTKEGTAFPRGFCAKEVRTSQWANGNEKYWPFVEHAAQLPSVLADPHYSKHWTMLKGITSLETAPQGTICVWGDQVAKGDGHIGIVWHEAGHTYLLGNFEGKSAMDVTSLGPTFQQADDYYLPALIHKQ